MTGKSAVEDAVLQSVEEYLKKLAPPKGQGNGPDKPQIPWLKDLHKNGLEMVWEAVVRLEKMVHNGETSASVGGPYLVDKKGPGLVPTRGPRRRHLRFHETVAVG